MATKSFRTQLDTFAVKTRRKMQYVQNEATINMIDEMQANANVDTGFMKASLRASTVGRPRWSLVKRSRAPNSYPLDPEKYKRVIRNAAPGATIFFAYLAPYVSFVEERYKFIRNATSKWAQFVQGATRRVRK